MVEWSCPYCEQKMYSACPAHDQEKVTCIFCGKKFPNPYCNISVQDKSNTKLIDGCTALERFSWFFVPSLEELEQWCREKYIGIYPTNDDSDGSVSFDRILATALWHAEDKYPNASNLDICSYASLVAYLATGLYNGFETVQYIKESCAMHIITVMADNIFSGDISGAQGNKELLEKFTYDVLDFLEKFYFINSEEAVVDLLESVDNVTAAHIILGISKVQFQNDLLFRIIEKFSRGVAVINILKEEIQHMKDSVFKEGVFK